jgi:hypothetical protein
VTNVNDPATGTPVLNDPTPQAGVAVTALTGGIADADGLAGVPFAFRWQAEDDGSWNDVSGATGASFTPGAAQVGQRLRVVVSFTDTNGTAESVTSAASSAVVAAGNGPAPGGGPGQGIGLGQTVAPVAPVPGLTTLLAAPGGGPAAGGGAATRAPARVSGLAVTAGSGPITVTANVPAGARVVRIRVFRTGGATGGTAKARAAAARGRLVATVYRPAPVAKRYRFRLTEPKLRRLPAGRYRVEIRAGRSRTVLGPASARAVKIAARAAQAGGRG